MFVTTVKKALKTDKLLPWRLIIAVLVIILGIIQLCGIWENAIDVCIPLMGTELVLQAISNWNKSRPLAIFNLCAAIFVFGCCIAVFSMRFFKI